MKQTFKIILLILFFSLKVFAQENVEKALEKGREAIKIMDEGKIDESIELLKEAQKLDPDRFDYPYEIAYAQYIKKDYKQTIEILEKLKTHKNSSERLFQLLGNSYDVINEEEKAFKAYDEGLEKFPNSGMIYLEKGNVHWNNKDYDKAIVFYEKGIKKDPKFPSNYYRAARVYCGSNNEVWGLLYGEIFMNLERNSKRTSEISKLLFDTYKSEIKYTNDTSMSVSFCQNMLATPDDFKDPKNIRLPFCLIYEPTLLNGIVNEKNIDINSLSRIRSRFIEDYYRREFNIKYPNILFDFQNKLKTLGYLEAYNHWILMKGDEVNFEKWASENKEQLETFMKWFSDNKLKVNEENNFHRQQY